MRRHQKVAARPRLRQREFAPPILVCVADEEEDAEDTPRETPHRHLEVVRTDTAATEERSA